MNEFYLLTTLTAVVLVGCATHDRVTVRLDSVRAADGISLDEAELIAEAYYEYEYGSKEGFPAPPRRDHDAWVVDLRFGLTGRHLATLRISAATGDLLCTSLAETDCSSISLAELRNK